MHGRKEDQHPGDHEGSPPVRQVTKLYLRLLSKQGDFQYNREVMKSLNEDLKTGQLKQIYLLYGQESYLK